MHSLKTRMHSEKCVLRRWHPFANPRVHSHTSGWDSLRHTQAARHSRLLLGYEPGQHVTVQNGARLNQHKSNDAPERHCEPKMHGLLVAEHNILFYSKLFYKSKDDALQ